MVRTYNVCEWPTPHLKNTTDVFCGRLESWNKLRSTGNMRYGAIGNPYPEAKYGRGTCIAMFEKQLMGRSREHEWWLLIHRCADYVKRGGDIRLWCYCAPKACHCDIIRREILRVASMREVDEPVTPSWAAARLQELKQALGLL